MSNTANQRNNNNNRHGEHGYYGNNNANHRQQRDNWERPHRAQMNRRDVNHQYGGYSSSRSRSNNNRNNSHNRQDNGGNRNNNYNRQDNGYNRQHGSNNNNYTTNNNIDFQALVNAVVQAIGNNGEPIPQPNQQQQPQQQQPQLQQQQQPQHQQRQDQQRRPTYAEQTARQPARQQAQPQQNNNRNHVRFTERDGTSTNPDFREVWRTLHKIIQLDYHLHNWTTLPRSISKTLDNLTANITPPDPVDGLASDIEDIIKGTGTQIRNRVHTHLRDRLNTQRAKLSTLNPQDKHIAIDVAFKHLNYTIGQRIPNLRTRLEEEANKMRPTPGTTTTIRTQSYTTPGNTSTITASATKRMRPSDTPPSAIISTQNRFQIFEDRETVEDSDAETIDFDLEAPPQQTDQTHGSQRPQKPIRKSFHVKDIPKVRFQPNTATVIISDSNLKKVPESFIPDDWQLEVLPGAKFDHIVNCINDLPQTETHDIVIAVGINHRTSDLTTTLSQMDRIEELKTKMGHRLHALGVSVGNNIPQQEATTVCAINNRLHEIFREDYIPPLDDEETDTDPDNIHYTQATTEMIWGSIVSHYAAVMRRGPSPTGSKN